MPLPMDLEGPISFGGELLLASVSDIPLKLTTLVNLQRWFSSKWWVAPSENVDGNI